MRHNHSIGIAVSLMPAASIDHLSHCKGDGLDGGSSLLSALLAATGLECGNAKIMAVEGLVIKAADEIVSDANTALADLRGVRILLESVTSSGAGSNFLCNEAIRALETIAVSVYKDLLSASSGGGQLFQSFFTVLKAAISRNVIKVSAFGSVLSVLRQQAAVNSARANPLHLMEAVKLLTAVQSRPEAGKSFCCGGSNGMNLRNAALPNNIL
jgi:hypothetical protein